MPWTTPALRQVREMVRDDITSALSGVSMVGNSVLRVMSDANAGLAHLTLRYIDWLARQLMPDTAEVEWLDRHGDIWLTNADGTTGRKVAAFARGTVTMTGKWNTVVPAGTRLTSATTEYETQNQINLGEGPTNVNVIALDGGADGNLPAGEELNLVNSIVNVDSTATVVALDGGTDEETDDDLRTRVLLRIRNPPMGGDQMDYVEWTLAVSGVTRAWCNPLEMGIGTVTVRFMMDELRASDGGLPNSADILAVTTYLNTVRPVAVKDFFVLAPVPQGINFTISDLEADNAATRAAIDASVRSMLMQRAEPGQTIYRSWLDEAISEAPGVDHYELTFDDAVMASAGNIAVMGTITYA